MGALTEKTAVVTGAGRGLGRHVAIRLAKMGARVALIARSEDQLRETATTIQADGGRAVAIAMDLGRQRSHEEIRDAVVSAVGTPSVLVNAAGTFGPIGLIRDLDPEAWIDTLLVNTAGHFLTCRAFVGDMIDSGWGRIINVTSAASLDEPGTDNSAYATSKTALNQFTRHLAAEIEGTGVTANVIHPGDVKTEMWSTIRDAARALGPQAERFREWAAWVEATGGDDPRKAVDLVESIVGEAASDVNGRFLWIKDGLRKPIPSWGDDPAAT